MVVVMLMLALKPTECIYLWMCLQNKKNIADGASPHFNPRPCTEAVTSYRRSGYCFFWKLLLETCNGILFLCTPQAIFITRFYAKPKHFTQKTKFQSRATYKVLLFRWRNGHQVRERESKYTYAYVTTLGVIFGKKLRDIGLESANV